MSAKFIWKCNSILKYISVGEISTVKEMWRCHVYFCSAKYSIDKLSTIDSGRVNVKSLNKFTG